MGFKIISFNQGVLFFINLILLCILIPFNCFSSDSFNQLRNEYESILDKKYVLLPHRGTFIAPFSHNANPNTDAYNVFTQNANGRGEFNKKTEAEFQISFLMIIAKKLFRSDFNLFIGYTHRSWWQVYNSDWSRPFRETNYSPEIFARKILNNPIDFLGGKFIAYDIGYIHQSNGQIQELSRSWDRIFFRFAIMYKDLYIKASIWHRINEDKDFDDNPDIQEYLGYGEIEIDKHFNKSRVQLRLIPGTRKQGAELTYSYPVGDRLRFFTRYSYGYGLSLIDYDHKSERVSLGFMLTDLFSSQERINSFNK